MTQRFVRGLLGAYHEFFAKKRSSISLIKFAENNFGINDFKTKFIKEAETNLRAYISMRNAIEHPEGHSGVFKTSNFTFCHDQKVLEPCWWREKGDEKEINKTSIRVGFEIAIHDLLTLAEDIFISWATNHLKLPKFMKIIKIPKEERNATDPIKYRVEFSLEDLQKIPEIS